MVKKARKAGRRTNGNKSGYAALDDDNDDNATTSNHYSKRSKGGKKQDANSKGAKNRTTSTTTQNSNNNHLHQKYAKMDRRNNKKGRSPKSRQYDDEAFRQSLTSADHRSISEMASDGNCLFRSLSDQLYGDYGNNHDLIRSDVCDYLEEHEEEFAVFLLMDEDYEGEADVADFGEYVERMRMEGEWGGNVELVSAARLYGRTITVFSGVGTYSIDSAPDGQPPKGGGPEILLSYHENGHYNSVRDDRQPPPGSVPVRRYFSDNNIDDRKFQVGKNRGKQARIKSNRKRKSPKPRTTPPGKTSEEEEEVAGSQTNNSAGDKENHHQQHSTHDGTTTNEEDRADRDNTDGKPVKAKIQRNEPCPCGSGLRYKKCCMAEDKNRMRLAKWKEKHGLEKGDDGVKDDYDDPKIDKLEGDFVVVKI